MITGRALEGTKKSR